MHLPTKCTPMALVKSVYLKQEIIVLNLITWNQGKQ